MKRSLLAALVAFTVVLQAATGAAAETVWSGLVMANNAPQPTPVPAELGRFESTLKGLFGYNQFQVIGQSRQTLKKGDEEWSASSKYFSLHVDSKAAKQASFLLNLQLFQDQKLLLETEAKLSKRSPLVIRGPQVGDGQLVLVMVIE